MRKILFSLVALGGIIGAYALSGLFPDNTDFPRIPIGTGTIGEVLGKILRTTNFELSNGLVGNSYLLSGTTASGYLHKGNCGSPTDVWVRVDATGTPICGLQKPVLAFGNIESVSGTVVVIRYSDGSNVTGVSGLALFAGDIVVTETGSATEIGFPSDNSILRLDELTHVELQLGTLGGSTVAQTIVNDGALWGRVLTSTGMDFGAGWYIAGVRGTSIAVSVTPAMYGDFIVPHSVRALDAVQYENIRTASSRETGTGQTIHVGLYEGAPDVIPGIATMSVTSIDGLYTNPWIRENTKKDVVYLNELSQSGAITTTDREAATRELTYTLPSQLGQDCLSLISGPTVHGFWGTTINTAVTNFVCSKPITAASVACGVEGGIIWSDTVGCGPYGLAYADLTKSGAMWVNQSGIIKSLDPRFEILSNDTTITASTNNILYDHSQFIDLLNDRTNHTDWRAGSELTSMWQYLDTGYSGNPDCGQIHAKNWVQGVYVKTLTYIGPEHYMSCPQISQYDKVYYLSGSLSSPTYTLGTNDEGFKIDANGEYLTYPINSLGNTVGLTAASLVGKTMTIELGKALNDPSNPLTTAKRYLIDGGTTPTANNIQYWAINGTCAGEASAPKICQRKSGTTSVYSASPEFITLNPEWNISTSTKVTLKIPVAPSQLIIGASYTTSPLNNINNTIKKISIQ